MNLEAVKLKVSLAKEAIAIAEQKLASGEYIVAYDQFDAAQSYIVEASKEIDPRQFSGGIWLELPEWVRNERA